MSIWLCGTLQPTRNHALCFEPAHFHMLGSYYGFLQVYAGSAQLFHKAIETGSTLNLLLPASIHKLQFIQRHPQAESCSFINYDAEAPAQILHLPPNRNATPPLPDLQLCRFLFCFASQTSLFLQTSRNTIATILDWFYRHHITIDNLLKLLYQNTQSEQASSRRRK